MSTQSTNELLDARGVVITPGDTAIYGFGVGRSVAMAETVVMGKGDPNRPGWQSDSEVSLTMSGRVRLRVVRRSYSSGEKPIVDVAPDRLVVLKPVEVGCEDLTGWREAIELPPSPLPTQDEKARAKIEESMAYSVEALRATEAPEWWRRPDGPAAEALALAEYLVFHGDKLKEDRRKLRALDD